MAKLNARQRAIMACGKLRESGNVQDERDIRSYIDGLETKQYVKELEEKIAFAIGQLKAAASTIEEMTQGDGEEFIGHKRDLAQEFGRGQIASVFNEFGIMALEVLEGKL